MPSRSSWPVPYLIGGFSVLPIMEKLLFLPALMMFCRVKSETTNLTGKVLIFRQETDNSFVKIPVRENIYSATVCLRFFSELRIREQTLFSMSTVYNGDCNGLNLMLERGQYKACLNETDISFPGMPHEQSDWNSICGTYDSQRGLIQLWVNGKRSLAKRFIKGGLTGSVETPRVVLGQRSQSFHTDYFNWQKSFMGELTDLHMWDFVLSPCEIQKYMKGSDFPLGNVINWKAINGFTQGGDVIIDDSMQPCAKQDG
ncbi:hypothetical protein AGOR_G00080520 [Albula goreensis]|uniref:Pentraxin (PTX) domain-containing protein n=1 Tax=Albula goreensis TaxID=1534307 RepID=A0A8T3DMC0_9TELE|nr:hypothetical protein AGOR_G00080520 [Albula goreensis]